VTAALVNGLGDSKKKANINVAMDGEVMRGTEDPLGELI
jgi:hypothetical protein